MEVHDREVIHAEVEQLEGAVTTCYHELILVDLRPSQIVKRIICVEAMRPQDVSTLSYPGTRQALRLFNLHALCGKTERKNPAIADNTKVG